MIKVVLVRHGQSQWNLENRFTGWTDVDLSEHGIREAHQAGSLLRSSGYRFDRAFTSVLKRAIRTLWIILDEIDQMWIPVEKGWELNERHYGALQGLNKAEIGKQYGAEQLKLWRRSYSTRPPALDVEDRRHPRFDPRYEALARDLLPGTESLEDTLRRVVPYWKQAIVPHLSAQRRVLIAAHGNSLRALIKYLEGIPDEEITELEIPTGIPLVYELDEALRVQAHYYLADPKSFQAVGGPATARPVTELH